MLVLTPRAIEAVRRILEEGGSRHAGKALRIAVENGGCSGMQYAFRFDQKAERDEVLPCDGFEVLVDEASVPYLEGCVVDFVSGVLETPGAGGAPRSGKQGFVVDNPNAQSQCGCGKSFQV